MGYVVSVAQLDRVSASDAEGCGFDPRRIRHKKAAFMAAFLWHKESGDRTREGASR